MGEYAKSIQAYDEAIRVDPHHAVVYNNKGNALKAAGEIGRAIEAYEHAIQLNPHYAEAYNNRGNALKSPRTPL